MNLAASILKLATVRILETASVALLAPISMDIFSVIAILDICLIEREIPFLKPVKKFVDFYIAEILLGFYDHNEQ